MGGSPSVSCYPAVTLSNRQRACLQAAASGCTAGETAIILHIAVDTVGHHLERARCKLGARSTCQAAVLAVTWGLIRVDASE